MEPGLGGYRRISMRRSLGILVLLALAVGCGDDEPSTVGEQEDPAPVITQLDLLTATAAGGSVARVATELPDDEAVREYAAQFRNDELGGEIVAAADAADVPDGQQLGAAVVAVGCDVPTAVEGTYVPGEDTVEVHATLPPSDRKCLAPITSVALMLLPA